MEMDAVRLDSVSRKEKSSVLHNIIVTCMRENNMTLENLDEACDIVQEIYRKNAMLKGWRKGNYHSKQKQELVWMKRGEKGEKNSTNHNRHYS